MTEIAIATKNEGNFSRKLCFEPWKYFSTTAETHVYFFVRIIPFDIWWKFTMFEEKSGTRFEIFLSSFIKNESKPNLEHEA